MAALQHGIATVGTDGHQTDKILKEHDGKAFTLAPVASPVAFCERAVELAGNRSMRESLGAEAKRLYDREFEWDRIAASLMESLNSPVGGVVLVPG